MATTYNEDGSTSKSVAERQEAKRPKSNGKRISNPQEGY